MLLNTLDEYPLNLADTCLSPHTTKLKENKMKMRYVNITRMGTATVVGATVQVPYNGPEFEFFTAEVLGLCRRAAAVEGGKLREGNLIAHVFEVSNSDLPLIGECNDPEPDAAPRNA